ncbi:MAG TPA: amidohydrolase family protein [Papillibacter sp.]|jgi:predicted TIM-barrel fold metal-dependent hydrolase|nr:amidohydrolase family protein [Papillibacter sp.]
MIIDFHTHIYPEMLAPRVLQLITGNVDFPFTPSTDGTLSGLLRYMDETGVDISVIQPVVTRPSQTQTVNEWAASCQSERIIAFGGIYPDPATYKSDIDAIVRLGLKGVKFHCESQNFTVDDPFMLRVYDYALTQGLIILHHAGYDPGFKAPYHSSPRQFANVVDQLRGGVFIAAHFGGYGDWDDVERYLVGRDIYLDTSNGIQYIPYEQFLRIVRNHGAERLLFATDCPWSDAKREIALLRQSELTDAEKELIFSGNAKRILGL